MRGTYRSQISVEVTESLVREAEIETVRPNLRRSGSLFNEVIISLNQALIRVGFGLVLASIPQPIRPESCNNRHRIDYVLLPQNRLDTVDATWLSEGRT